MQRTLCASLLLCTVGWLVAAEPAETSAEPDVDLTDLSIEELMEIEVTSVAKKVQKLSQAAAAIYVLTSDDIRRSGATSIAEALRLVPGLEVARIDSAKWAISSRGFNSRFANKLLVLMDGRSIYTPLFSGVFWEAQDTVLEDIDRIEVIRGPGGTLWGANAVNGVINIITKSAADTQGGLVTVGSGTEERGVGQVRYGGVLSDHAHFRVYAKYFDRGPLDDEDGHAAADDWSLARAGFRIDWDVSDADAWTVQGDYYDGQAGQTTVVPIYAAPFGDVRNEDADMAGGNLLARWRRTLGDDSDLALQLYYDWTKRDEIVLEQIHDTFDIDFQHRFPLGERQEILWGLGYRLIADHADGPQMLTLDPENRTDHLFSAFIQDELTVVPDRLVFTIGSKFERNDYTGFEYQPSARLLWTPHSDHTVWAAVSRAVRTPARIEHDVELTGNRRTPPGAFPRMTGDSSFESEDLLAYELGYRVRPSSRLSFDLATFCNVYDDLRTGEVHNAIWETTPGPGHIIVPLVIDNKMDGVTYGAELAVHWQPLDWWQVRVGYTFLEMQLELDHDSTDPREEGQERESPENQAFLRSSMDLPWNLEFDLIGRYVDNVSVADAGAFLDQGRYLELDARLAWRPTDDLEIFLSGQNLLKSRHPEFGWHFIRTEPTETERGVYAGLRYRF